MPLQPETRSTDFYTKVLALFLLVALAICVSVLISLDSSSLFAINHPELFVASIIIQIAVILTYIFIWQKNLNLCGLSEISFRDASLHSGIAFLGKYIPGKVGGLVMRGLAVYKKNKSGGTIIKATTIEQMTLLHSGLIICLLLWASETTLPIFIACVLISALSLLVITFPGYLAKLTRPLASRFPSLKDKLSVLEQDIKKPYYTTLILTCVSWLLTATAVYLCVLSFSIDIPFQKMLFISTFSYLAGFVIFILPAGLGARDASFVLLLSPWCNTLTAIAAVSLHRIITITIDLLVGIYALHGVTRDND